LKDIVFHTANGTVTGDLYTSSLELLFIEMGCFLPLRQASFSIWGELVSPSLIKSTWSFLDCYGLELHTDITLDLPR
jgi:hypothetical protein